MTDADQKIEEAVEEKVAEQAEAVSVVADAAIEAAQQRVENAEAVAQSLADAAAMSETGRRLDAHIAENETWRARVAGLETEIAGLKSTLADLSAKLPPTLIAPVAEPMLAPKGSSIPPASEKTEVILADNPAEAEAGQKGPAEKPKRKRFAL